MCDTSNFISHIIFENNKNNNTVMLPDILLHITRKHSSRMHTAHLPTTRALVATRCQYLREEWGPLE